MNESDTKVTNHGGFTLRLWDGSNHYDIKPGENFVPNDVWWRLNDLPQIKSLLAKGRISAPALEPENYPVKEDDSQTIPEAANAKQIKKSKVAIQTQGNDIETVKIRLQEVCEETRFTSKKLTKRLKQVEAKSMEWLKDHTTVGGGASEDIEVKGLRAGHVVMVMMQKVGATPRVLNDWVVAQDKITLNFDGDPVDDHKLVYLVVN